MQNKVKVLLFSLYVSHFSWADLTVIADFGGESAVRFMNLCNRNTMKMHQTIRIPFQPQ